MITNIEELRDYLSTGEFHSSDILSILSVLRIQIEKDNSQSKYHWLNLFANWCLHDKIDKSNTAIDIFEMFYTSIGTYDTLEGKSPQLFYNSVFDNFRLEIQSLLSKYNINIGLINNERAFCTFLIGILFIIKNKQINLPERINQEQKIRIIKLPELLNLKNNRPDLDFTPLSLIVKHESIGTFSFSLTTKGHGEHARLIFNLSDIGYRGTKFIYKPD